VAVIAMTSRTQSSSPSLIVSRMLKLYDTHTEYYCIGDNLMSGYWGKNWSWNVSIWIKD